MCACNGVPFSFQIIQELYSLTFVVLICHFRKPDFVSSSLLSNDMLMVHIVYSNEIFIPFFHFSNFRNSLSFPQSTVNHEKSNFGQLIPKDPVTSRWRSMVRHSSGKWCFFTDNFTFFFLMCREQRACFLFDKFIYDVQTMQGTRQHNVRIEQIAIQHPLNGNPHRKCGKHRILNMKVSLT